ncbi:MAG TPA: hypothetical protein VFA65_06925, partial [Bryobacteraceae bacterium]|nr:hypothetical protein [Bryobacteraceae bacterium]
HRYNRIVLQTHMTYEKQFRNFQIQEARLDRKRAKAMAELERLQAERKANEQPSETQMSDDEFFAALDAGYVPPAIAAQLAKNKQAIGNGFVFSNDDSTASVESSATPEIPIPYSPAA